MELASLSVNPVRESALRDSLKLGANVHLNGRSIDIMNVREIFAIGRLLVMEFVLESMANLLKNNPNNYEQSS